MLPPVVVGTAAHLKPLVQLLCAEMSLAFEQHGLSLPPWRQSKSVLSKWVLAPAAQPPAAGCWLLKSVQLCAAAAGAQCRRRCRGLTILLLPVSFPLPCRWLPTKARDYDLSPFDSPRASSPEPLFPLACTTAAAAFAGQQQAQQQQQRGAQSCSSPTCSSAAASGSLTPFSPAGDDGGASPRAVLRSASALLLSQQQQQAAAAAAAGGDEQQQQHAGNATAGTGLRKSLLSSSLAANSHRQSGGGEAQQPRRSAAASPEQPRVAARPATPTATATTTTIHRASCGAGGISYRISTEWQQPAIRTVKMQGPSPTAAACPKW
jgi:hypothetical protein